jgi:hypothetical protein
MSGGSSSGEEAMDEGKSNLGLRVGRYRPSESLADKYLRVRFLQQRRITTLAVRLCQAHPSTRFTALQRRHLVLLKSSRDVGFGHRQQFIRA